MKKILVIILEFLLFIFLTTLTQVGGIIYYLNKYLNRKLTKRIKYQSYFSFLILYLVFTFLIIPLIAPLTGRERIKHSNYIQPTNYLTVLLNRNYVSPELNKILLRTTERLKGTNIKISYLDGNFPFINKFPLLPHLSHNDGKKLDISLVYETEEGNISDKQKSRSGYGIFEEPLKGEFNQIEKCLAEGYFQYDYPKYLTLGSINKKLMFSEKGTKILIDSLLAERSLSKLFIEPHLKERLKLKDRRIRYHGCRSVRHDDHIHIQI